MCDAVMETTEMAVSLAVTSSNPIEYHCKSLFQSILDAFKNEREQFPPRGNPFALQACISFIHFEKLTQ